MKDYIPSNQYPDYLMHYGVKGMTWKDHVKKDVESVKSNIKTKIKMLKLFIKFMTMDEKKQKEILKAAKTAEAFNEKTNALKNFNNATDSTKKLLKMMK